MMTQQPATTTTSALRRSMLVLALASLLPGCGAVSGAIASTKSMVGLGPKPVTADWKTLAINVEEDANSNSAVALDIVFIRDQAMLEALLVMPATKWFSTRTELKRSFPEAFTVLSYELPPAMAMKVERKLWKDETAWAVLVFANYLSPGEHRARLLLNNQGYVVQLGALSFSASDLKPGTAQ